MALSRKEKDQKIYLAGKIFTPATPIISKELFSGRNDQIIMIIDAINTPGQHPIIYGERGVGKTSLANVISDILASQGEHVISIRINCDNTDDFSSIWEKVLGEITLTTTLNKPGFVSDIHQETESFTNDILRDDKGKIIITPNLVRKKLSIIGEGRVLICILDEFDRIENDEAKQLISDTIKSLSDFGSPVTLFLVGVAESIGDLVSKHESIERALVQVRMPRMSIQEVRDIITTGVSKLEMGIEDNALNLIVSLSKGLPHYAHLLGLNSARSTVEKDRKDINLESVMQTIDKALEHSQSIKAAHHKATSSTQDTIFPHVLLACALAPVDDLGFFTAKDICQPLSNIMGKTYYIPGFAKNINDLCKIHRGEILEKKGLPKNYRFRFKNPLIPPYVIMKGIANGLIDEAMIDNLS